MNYYDKNGSPIQHAEWLKLRKDDAYRYIHRYENDRVRVMLEWVGEVPSEKLQTFREFWPIFRLTVENATPKGWVVDPADGERTFGVLDEAIEAYQSFLVRWTECSWDAGGTFLETGNKLAPPNPYEPTTQAFELDPEVGAW